MPDPTFVGTRCCVPRVSGLIVRRPRLEALLAPEARRRVTLVAGPPGVGKTTLLGCCFGREGDSGAAWLTVDGSDDRPRRLAALVSEALRRRGAVVDPIAPDLSDEALLDAVFEQVIGQEPARVLVLDDVQELRAPATLRLLAYLVERAPAELHLVLSSRADPPIAWSRLKLEGDLRQVRWADLAFSRAEAAELVAAHGVHLDDGDVGTLWRRTEGWAAGLRLAIGALQSDADPHRFIVEAASTQEATSEYLLGEVLARQDAEVQDFLLSTSVAASVTPELAVALTGDAHAGARLAELFHRGLFLTQVDGTRRYRFHPLFRALLQAHLLENDHGKADRLHRTAAAWHLAAGMTREAEGHARVAGDWALVGRLILERWLAEMVDELEPGPEDPLAGVPASAVLEIPELAMVAVTEACRWGRHEEADLYRGALPASSPPTLGESGRPIWKTAQLLCDVAYGWSFGADDRSRAAVATLRTLTPTEPATLRLRQLAVLAEAGQDIDSGDLARAHRNLEELVEQGEMAWPRTLALAILAVIEAASGALWASEERSLRLLTELDGRATAPAVRLAKLAAILCSAQKGRKSTVESVPSPDAASPEWSSVSLRYLDRVVRGAANGAAPFFLNLDEATARHPLAERALLALGVLEVLDPRGRPILLGGTGERVVLEARRRLAEGVPERADGMLTNWLDHPADRHPRTAVEAAVLATIAADRGGDPAAAEARLRTAFELSSATGIMAPLIAHGAHLRDPVRQHVDDLDGSATVALELLDRLQSPGAHDLVESLTEREIAVLRRLPTLMSNAEIAEALHLSVNTVKTHLKALYRKLGVGGRREAVQRGRELELV